MIALIEELYPTLSEAQLALAMHQGDLRRDVAQLRGRLLEHAAAPGARFALYHEDPYHFGVGLFALWHTGCVAVLAAQAGATLVFDRDDVVRKANAAGISVYGFEAPW